MPQTFKKSFYGILNNSLLRLIESFLYNNKVFYIVSCRGVVQLGVLVLGSPGLFLLWFRLVSIFYIFFKGLALLQEHLQ